VNLSRPATRVAALVLTLAATALGTSACSSSSTPSAKSVSCTDFAGMIATAITDNNSSTDQATVLANAQGLSDALSKAATAATDPNAKAAMTTFADDYAALVGAMTKAQAGDKAAAASVTGLSAKVTADSATVKSVCGS
jgi:hypothetical protein